MQGFHEDLVEWGRKQLAKWDNDPIFSKKKHLGKFVTRRRFELYLDVKQKKFLKQLKRQTAKEGVFEFN